MYMASEEGVDHQEAHFRPALLLRGIPADLDPASEGRAVLKSKAGAGFLFIKFIKNTAKFTCILVHHVIALHVVQNLLLRIRIN